MGNGILIVLAAALLGGVIVMRNTQEAAVASEGIVSAEEDRLLAREIALSAMNKAVAEASRSFDTAEAFEYQDVSYQDGTYDVTVDRIDPATVVLESVGTFNDRLYRIRTTLFRTTSIQAPIITSAPSAKATFGGNNMEVSGIDTAPPSAPGVTGSPNTDTNGVKASSEDVKDEFIQSLAGKPQRIHGVDGNADVIDGSFPLDPNVLYNEAKAAADVTIPGGSINGNNTYGSPASPVVVVVNGNATVSGQMSGYGVLLIDGDLSLGSGQFTWEGIVLAKNDGLNANLSGNANIYGAMILIGDDAGGGCQGGRALCFGMSGQSGVYYSTEAISRLASKVPSVISIMVADRWVGTE